MLPRGLVIHRQWKRLLKKATGVFSLAFLCVVAVYTHAHASEFETSLGPQFGYLSGHTTYHISSYSGSSGVESELEFPLRAALGGLKLTARDEKMTLELGLMTNLTSGSGKLKDSDWLTNDLDIQETGQAHPGKDIYSESAIDLRALIFEGSLKAKAYTIGPVVLLPRVGGAIQYFEFSAYDTEQVGYGPYASLYTVSVSGKTIDYNVTYFFFYLGPEFEVNSEGLGLSAGVYFCPYVYATDRDDHLLRYKLSEAETDGTGYMAALSLYWTSQRGPEVSLKASYIKLDTDGTQTQTFYDGPYQGQTFSVDDTIKTEQWTGLLSVLWRF
ncbi:MAG: omptin family outer membrane protease [Nitrospirae bacterium]|nr:MAG: omptin family outer membrane protease [Nitrospirota bacterium]